MKVVYTNTAKFDLQEIYEYIAYTLMEQNTAKVLSEKITQEIRALEFMPERHPPYQEEPWRSQGVRFLRVKTYLAFYTVDPNTDTVSVARIMYGSRDLSHQLEETYEW